MPPEAPGIILVPDSDAEILRRQCEASAHAYRDSGVVHQVQLIPLGQGQACIRVFGNFRQFVALLDRLKFPDSGWKPHERFSAWWKQNQMLQPGAERGLLFLNNNSGTCSLLHIRDGSRRKLIRGCSPFRYAPLNPDTLQFLECTSFE